MIDANSQFFATLTNVGMAKQANADALGIAWTFAQMGVGDANGTDPVPSAAQTSLINERRRRPLNQVKVDPVNPAVIITEQIIPADEGGWWIRELGLYDADGDLVAVANCAPSYKPVLAQGSGRTQVVRMNFIVASTGNITLKIDPAVVLATRDYVDSRIQEELYKLDSKQSVRVATTANIVLAGLQSVDGVALAAGDRVLVKNQTVAKDNGIWLAASLAWKRAADADSDAEVTSALLMSVEQGTTQADTRWQLITDGAIVVGTTALTFQNVTQGFAPINAPALISPTANTPAQFDSSLLLINSAFLKRRGVEFGDYTNYSASAVLTVADVGKVAAFASATSGAMLATLPSGGLIPRGALVEILCGQGSVTVTAAAGEIIDAVNFVGNIAMGVGDTALFIRIGTLWRLIGGSVALKYAAVMSGPNWTTQALFASDKSLATTEFVQREKGSFAGGRAIGTSGTVNLSAADAGQFISIAYAGAQSVVLPLLADVPVGTTIALHNPSGFDKTIAGAGTDKISPDGSLYASVILKWGDTTILTKESTVWRLTGPAALKYSAQFAFSNAAQGYQKLPSGLIIQWGDTAPAVAGDLVHTLPIAFPTSFRKVVISQGYTAGSNSVGYASAGVASAGTFVWRGNIVGNACQYLAIGY
ncbi:phage tail protein [Pseudomonas jessenii]|uniref:phage tail protein n=1 Tax=Pseudomonas jessenii TaxID=77298 RepID=UPI003892CC26